MSEFKSKWMNFPETHKNLSDKSAKSPFVTFVTSLSVRSGEKKDLAVADAPPVEENELDQKSLHGLNRYPPPIGYGGYDLDEVAWAERWNDKMGVIDPTYRKLNCWMWLASSYLTEGSREMAIKARNEYQKLRHEDETITEECGLCKAHEISPLDSLEGL